ncbi:MAG: outer membrane beta-barrel protein [Pseudomonadota bacterium]
MFGMRKRAALFAAAIVMSLGVWPSSASAQSGPSGFYISAFGGYATGPDFDFTGFPGGGLVNGRVLALATVVHAAPAAPLTPFHEGSTDDGFTAGGAIGFIVSAFARFEVEVAHASFDNATFAGGAAPTVHAAAWTPQWSPPAVPIGPGGGSTVQNAAGGLDITTLLFNGWFNTRFGIFAPYVGGGVGLGFVNHDIEMTGAGFSFDGTGLAVQFGGGVRIDLTRQLELDLAYRAKTVRGIDGDVIGGTGTTSDGDYTWHTVQVGVVFKLN